MLRYRVSPSVLNDVIPQLGEKSCRSFESLLLQLNSVFTSMSSNQLNMVVPSFLLKRLLMYF